MSTVVKVRIVNESRFLAIPKSLVEKIGSNYMAVRLDELGRLIYTPVSEGI
jgi:hypothetical protein